MWWKDKTIPTFTASILLLCSSLLPTFAEQIDGTAAFSPAVVEVAIKARQFHPPLVKLAAGKEVRLVFHNKDAELHAFVPIMFLDNLDLHVEGNGAPQFDRTGLKRVLIPSDGRAEIWFVPPSTGLYTYRCDLPGHQMVGQIIVE